VLMKRNGSGSRSEAQFFFSLQRCCCCLFFLVVLWCCSRREKQVSKKTTIPSSVGAFVFFLPLFQKSFPSLLSVHSSLVQLSKGSPAFVPSSVFFSVYFFFFVFSFPSCLLSLSSPPLSVSPLFYLSCPPVFPSSSFLFRSNSPSLFSFKRALYRPSKIPPLFFFFACWHSVSIYRGQRERGLIMAAWGAGQRRSVGQWVRLARRGSLDLSS